MTDKKLMEVSKRLIAFQRGDSDQSAKELMDILGDLTGDDCQRLVELEQALAAQCGE